MANVKAVANGNWSSTSTWDGGVLPTVNDDVFANGFTITIDGTFEVLSIRNTSGTGIVAGGSFRFANEGNLTCTSSQAIYVGAITPTLQMSLPGGNIGTFTGDVLTITNTTGYTAILLSNTGTLNLNGNYQQINTSVSLAIILITSAGILNINGDLYSLCADNTQTFNVCNTLRINGPGNVNINGNIVGALSNLLAKSTIYANSSGIVTINGNITGGSGTNSPAVGIVQSTLLNVTGTVTGNSSPAIISNVSNQINISGSVVASANANAITSTNASGIVILNGNITNNAGRQAIYCQNLFLSDTGTTQAQFFTSGSQDRTLYSANTFPNLPSSSIVRSTTLYGPGNELSGSIIMPDPANVRYGVPTDNTTGSALLSAETLFDEIATSTNPVAVRLRKSSTTDTFGNMLTAFKK
jgi:hypothetical protein